MSIAFHQRLGTAVILTFYLILPEVQVRSIFRHIVFLLQVGIHTTTVEQ